jgi:hypothetical protein
MKFSDAAVEAFLKNDAGLPDNTAQPRFAFDLPLPSS